jgi:hypothetical protein
LAEEDVSVRVLAKMVLHLPVQRADLLVQRAQHRYGRADRRRVGGSNHVGLSEVVAAEHTLDSCGPVGDLPPVRAAQRRTDLGDGQPGGRRRIGRLVQQVEGIDGVEVLEGIQGSGEVLAQRVAQPLRVSGAFPNHRLVGAGEHLDRFGFWGVGVRPHVSVGVRPEVSVGVRPEVSVSAV